MSIEVHNLTKTFHDLRRGEVAAVDDVSFSVKPGEILALLGPNGAGKTTAMRVLCTVLQPTKGSARVAGYDVVEKAEEVRQNIGFLSANTGVYDRMTAREFVSYFGRLHGMSKAVLRQRIGSLFKTLRMEDFADMLGSKMSTGMRQKTSIARTIIHDPPVLVFDEPTMGLDVMVARNVLQSIQELRDEGKCILFSTHIMREVEKISDRVAIIHQGQLLAVGTLEELRNQYGQEDVEEIFYQLIQQAEREEPALLSE